MLARRAIVLVLLGCGCSAEPTPSGGSDESGESADTSAGDASSTDGASEPSDSSDTDGSSDGATTDHPSDTGETDGEETGETGETGDTGMELPEGSPGCTALTSLEEGEQQFMLDGLERRYIVRLPEGYSTDRPWPLVLALHGNGGNPDNWDTLGGDTDIRTAFRTDAIIIIPEAINNAWRDYDSPADSWPAGIELELNYFDTIVETATNQLCIDEDNIFSMGFSGGGSFSGVLGCRREYIRAIAVGGAVIYFEPEQCVSTPAAWVTIGELEFNAGREAFRDFFRTLAGCEPTSMGSAPEGCVAYDNCGMDTPVTFCSHPGGHVWPSLGTDATKAFFESFYAAE
ncbi:hypothetical protein [Enhygromyxa salina]|uniref:Uncharacterized protein n=1 Tax=Enhygromyxa salina TaxID=215803 RepID=A0A2S9YYQ9_9BACT|nr:hypothetical protein [Enhygromyxa salina]PRQ10214.1 hypothetical protein ENSA7_00220 [Enhygromyxa salina]